MPVFFSKFYWYTFHKQNAANFSVQLSYETCIPHVITVDIQRAPSTPEHSLMPLCNQLLRTPSASRLIFSQILHDRTATTWALQCVDSLAVFWRFFYAMCAFGIFGFYINVLIQNTQKKNAPVTEHAHTVSYPAAIRIIADNISIAFTVYYSRND